MKVGVAGAAGRMGRLVAEGVVAAPDLELVAAYDPSHAGTEVAGLTVSAQPEVLAECEVVVDFTRPEAALANIEHCRQVGSHCVVGTSGFDQARLTRVTEAWGAGPPNCLIVPNFSIGAVLMMRFAELAAPHFAAAEVVELHHDRKADAPSGTATSTAQRIAEAAPEQSRAVESAELVPGSRGGRVGSVPVHAVRLPGLLAHQEVLLGNPGELLTIRHDTTDRVSFLPGVLLAVRRVADLPGVTVGLERLLEL